MNSKEFTEVKCYESSHNISVFDCKSIHPCCCETHKHNQVDKRSYKISLIESTYVW